MSNYIVIAKIGKPHGLKGYFFFYPFSSSVDELFNFSTFYKKKENIFIPLPKIIFKNSGNNLIAKIKGINSVEEIKHLINIDVYILKKELPPLDGEYYHFDLIDCKCYYEDKFIGVVKDIVNYGAGELFEIETKKNKTYFIPFLKDKLLDVSIDNKSIYFKDLEGFI